MTNSETRLIPTGKCWCGCGTDAALGKFFALGHDKIAEAALMAARYESSVARLLFHHGYGPERPVIKEAMDEGNWQQCICGYPGAPASLANHVKKYGHGHYAKE